MQKYKTIKTLGDGAFGSVYKALNIKTGECVAIKKMKQKYTSWNQCIELRQIKSLRKLNHVNVIKLKQVLLVSQQLYMVFEYLDYNLYEVYSKMKSQNKHFTQKQIKSICYQIVSGLAHMHRNGFFHRDMKPQNLLLYNDMLKVCDMGLARQIRSRPPFTDYVSTRWYRSPELLLRATNYNSPVDIFALGCIMAELYNLCPLFAGSNEVDQLNKIVKILGTPTKDQWPQGYKLAHSRGYYFPSEKGVDLAQIIPDASLNAIDLIQSMLRFSSRKRPTAIQILKHQYFKDVSLQSNTETKSKDIVFEQKPSGIKLDTTKEDKQIHKFRATKQKFKQTRKYDALESNPFKVIENQSKHQPEDSQDLDSIIKMLQDKNNNKKKPATRLPLISTKEKFYDKYEKKDLRQSKTEIKYNQPYKFLQKQDWKHHKNINSRHDEGAQKKYISSIKRQVQPSYGLHERNKFSYNFQPVLNPVMPILSKQQKDKHISAPLGYLPLPKPNLLKGRGTDLPSSLIPYKY